MTRAEQVAICRKCTNRGFDPTQGIICSLTNEIANFTYTCKNYTEDTSVKEQPKIYSYASPTKELANLASQSKRFLNFAIDFAAILAFSFFLGIVFSIFAPSLSLIPNILLGIFINLSFFCFFEIVFKQTPGKMITGTKVVADDGSEVNAGQILGRSLSRMIPFEPFSFLGDSPGWHDTISGTRVIDLSMKINQETEIALD